MIATRLSYLLLLLLVTAVYIFSNSYLLLLLLLALITAALVSLLSLLLLRPHVRLHLSATGTREPLLCWQAENSGVLPGRVCIRLRLTNCLSGAATSERRQMRVDARHSSQQKLRLMEARTGQVRVELNAAHLSDLLGLFRIKLPQPAPLSVMIYPQLRPVVLTQADQPPGNGDGSTYSQYRPGNDVNEIFALHEYAAGDDLRRIHWKLSAKSDALLVRDYGLPLDRPLSILIAPDSDSAPELLSACLDVGVSLSAALLEAGLGHRLLWPDQTGSFLLSHDVLDLAELEDALPSLLACHAAPTTSLLSQVNLPTDMPQLLYLAATRPELAEPTLLPDSCRLITLPVDNESKEIYL